MLGQTFQTTDIPTVAALALVEVILSADNAVVLGILTYSLPAALRRKALFIGVVSAFVLRALAIFAVSLILTSIWLGLIGAAYLLYLSISYFVKKGSKPKLTPPASFWKTVLLIEFFDLAFALDSIIAGVAFIATPQETYGLFHPKLWIVYTGGMIGLLAIRYVANFFATLIHRFPSLEPSAHLLIGLIGLKLAFSALPITIPYFKPIFWTLFVLTLLSGLRPPSKTK